MVGDPKHSTSKSLASFSYPRKWDCLLLTLKVVPLASLVVTFPPHAFSFAPHDAVGFSVGYLNTYTYSRPTLLLAPLLTRLSASRAGVSSPSLPSHSDVGMNRLPQSTILSGGPGRMMRPSTVIDEFRFTSGMTLKQSFRFWYWYGLLQKVDRIPLAMSRWNERLWFSHRIFFWLKGLAYAPFCCSFFGWSVANLRKHRGLGFPYQVLSPSRNSMLHTRLHYFILAILL